jgi:hypothetical protein
MKHRYLYLSLAGLILSACVVKENDSAAANPEDEVFFATIEDPSSRVYVDDGLHVLWNADDRISLFNHNTRNQEFWFTGNDGDKSGIFAMVYHGTPVGSALLLNKQYAVYPYREETCISDDGTLSVILPAEQAYRENSFGRESNTMISVSDDYQMEFKNLCGYLTLRLFGDNVSVSSISLKGNNSEPLAGQATVVASPNSAPSLTFDASATPELSIHFDTPVLLGDSPDHATVFWLVIPPVRFSQGITLTVTDSDGVRFEKKASSDFTIERNTLYKMALLRVGPAIPGEVPHVFLDKKMLTLGVGESAVLHATVYPEDATDKTVVWTSSDESVATVDGEGCVTAVKPGRTIITAKTGEGMAVCNVTVTGEEDDPIIFADQILKTALLFRFDTNKDGELSYKEAAAVTSMEYAVAHYAEHVNSITSFDEFQFFTGVTSLPEKYFTGWESLSSIVLPPSMTSVSKNAFYNCHALKSVVLPEVVTTIESGAFYGCDNLSSFVLPQAVTRIENSAFSGCESLASVDLPEGLDYLGASAFANCKSLSSINLPSGLSEIASATFSGCESLTAFHLPAGITGIGAGAFAYSGLQSILIPKSVTSIGGGLFAGCSSLASLEVEAGNPVYDSRDHCNAVIKTELGQLFFGGSINTVIPGSVTSIADRAFYKCSVPHAFVIPGNVTSVGEDAFRYCLNLSSLTISEGVERLDRTSFAYCDDLTSVIIPSSMLEIGGCAFYGCHGLASVQVNAITPPIAGIEIFDWTTDCPIWVPAESVELYKTSRNWSKLSSRIQAKPSFPGEVAQVFLDKTVLNLVVGNAIVLHATVLPEDATDKTVIWTSSDESVATVDGVGCVTAVKPGIAVIMAKAGEEMAFCTVTVKETGGNGENDPIVFADETLKAKLLIRFDTDGDGELSYKEAAAVTSMENFVIGVAVKSITSFDEFQYFTGVTTLPEKCFADWESLSSIVFPPRVTSVSKNAFYNCHALKSVVLPEGMTTIESGAFCGCDNLSSFGVPQAVTRIEDSAFSGCNSLASVALPKNLRSVGKEAFSKSGLTSVVIPGGVSEVGEKAFLACSHLQSVVFSNGVQTICSAAFRECGSLESVDFCPTITSIERQAFRQCTNLKSVSVPSGVTTLEYEAFYGCKNLSSLILPKTLVFINYAALCGCESLVSVDLPEGLSAIGHGAFSGCKSLVSITLPTGLTVIDRGAFVGCTSLQSILIPKSVTQLGPELFQGCSSLASLEVEGGNPVYDSRDHCNAVIETSSAQLIQGGSINTVIPRSVTSIGDKAFYYCFVPHSLVIPGNVTYVGTDAFRNSFNLSSLTVSEGVERLGQGSFAYCDDLTSVIIPNSMLEIGGSAFYGCRGLSSVQINAVTPPTAGIEIFGWTTDCPIWVPAESVELYKTSYTWSRYSDRIRAIEP